MHKTLQLGFASNSILAHTFRHNVEMFINRFIFTDLYLKIVTNQMNLAEPLIFAIYFLAEN